MKADLDKDFSALRPKYLAAVLKHLEDAAPISVEIVTGRKKYRFHTLDGREAPIPAIAGVYVLYSKKTGKPVYVGESDNLQRRLKNHCSLSGASVFKTRWVRHWIGDDSTKVVVMTFVHRNVFFRFVQVPFGRAEIEDDLRTHWKIEGPQSFERDDIELQPV